jgi:hypothetical protein
MPKRPTRHLLILLLIICPRVVWNKSSNAELFMAANEYRQPNKPSRRFGWFDLQVYHDRFLAPPARDIRSPVVVAFFSPTQGSAVLE